MEPKNNFVNFARSEQFATQPETLELNKQKKQLSIGVPKEIAFQETRIGLVPEAVSMLVNNGHSVLIETGAGKNAHFPDHEFSEAGGQIVYSAAEVYQADYVVKVAPPLPSEIEKIKNKTTLFSALNLPGQTDEYFKQLMLKKTTAISYEHIKDQSNTYPVIRSLGEIVGVTCVYIASEYLGSSDYGKAKSLGGFSGIAPAKIVILGAGTVGEYAARAALGMGAEVKIFDNSVHRLRTIQHKVNQRLFTSIITQNELTKALITADVVIGALHCDHNESPLVISEDMVRQMQPGSVIIDVCIVNGGCCETSHTTNHTHPVFKKHGVTHYCVPNIPSKIPHTASIALSNFFAPVLMKIAEEGGIENYLRCDAGFRYGTYLYNGILTNKYISEVFNISCQDIDLLMFPYH